jgi:tetratricopeptide (TPR) repeat protein
MRFGSGCRSFRWRALGPDVQSKKRFEEGLMGMSSVLVVFFLFYGVFADNPEKAQKKELEAQVRDKTREAQGLEAAGRLAEARAKYAESQALLEMQNVTDAIKRLDEEIKNRIKGVLSDARKFYDAKKYKEAAALLEDSMKLQAFQSVLMYDLALCDYQSGDRAKALEYLTKAKAGTVEPKQRQKVLQLMAMLVTGENGISVNEGEKARIVRVNQLADSIGLESSLGDESGAEELSVESDTVAFEDSGEATQGSGSTKQAQPAKQSPQAAGAKGARPTAAVAHSDISASHRASLCNALSESKSAVAGSAAATFDLANCSETNGRTGEAVRLLEKYGELAPKALDAEESRARVADLKALLTVEGPDGAEIRRLHAAAYGALSERKYDRALAAFNKAQDLAPEFGRTKWKLALLHEAMGDVEQARASFKAYQELMPDQADKDEAALHLSTLDIRRTKYDEEVDEAGDIVADLFDRAMNLTWNEDGSRKALRSKRARVKKKEEKKIANRMVGGFAIPFAYAQQQLAKAGEHLQVALALFPLGAEANELMGLVFLQANDGHAAMRSFDVVASQGLPVSFYAELRDRKQDRAVKCELSHDRIRLIYLSSYDKKGNPAPPGKPAGDDGLGDLVIDPTSDRKAQFDSLDIALSDIKKLETVSGVLRVRLGKQDIMLSPIYLPSFTPVMGPQARRFANNYTRLFVRYPGLEDAKLGTEGMTGGEKFEMGMKIANASMGMAMGGFGGINAIGSVQDAISIARTIQAAKVSLNVSFATWEKSADDQQQLLAGKAFKAIPVQPVSLAFLGDAK